MEKFLIKINRNVFEHKFRIFCLITFSLLSAIFTSCKESKTLEIGGFKFGSSMQDALEEARVQGYKIEPVGDYVISLSGHIQALGIEWKQMSIMADPVNGVKQITLSRQNSKTSKDIKTTLFNEMKNLYPDSESKPYIESFTIFNESNGKSLTIPTDHEILFELKDSKDEYSGNVFHILSKDDFSAIICKKHTKDW